MTNDLPARARERRASVRALTEKLTEDQQLFLRGYAGGSSRASAILRELNDTLSQGATLKQLQYVSKRYAQLVSENTPHEKPDAPGVKPSRFVQERLSWFLDGFVPANRREFVFFAVERIVELPFQTGPLRRSMRCLHPSMYLEQLSTFFRSVWFDDLFGEDLTEILTAAIDRQFISHIITPLRVAHAIDTGDEAACAVMREILQSDRQSMAVDMVIRGAIISKNAEFHQLVGKLLVAARLQEGLRQVICENADMGSLDAFLHLIGVIDDNGLIRFAGVKRGVGVWLGLIGEDSPNTDRVSDKSLRLIRRCLTDASFIEECLQTEDSMAIHIGLWALGVRDVEAATVRGVQLAKSGTHHQRLTACHFLSELQNPALTQVLCAEIAPDYPDELDVQAICLGPLIQELIRLTSRMVYEVIYKGNDDHPMERLDMRFDPKAMYAHLKGLIQPVGKGVSWDSCVFPGMMVSLSRSDLAVGLMGLAWQTQDDALIEDALAFFPDANAQMRADALVTLCRDGKHNALLIASTIDKSGDTRRRALHLLKKQTLNDADYAAIRSVLRCKYGDVRPGLLELLKRQDDDTLHATVTALLADKDAQRRLAGLSIIKDVCEDSERAALKERLSGLLPKDGAQDEQNATVIQGIHAQSDTLYTAEDAYRPHIADVPELESCASAWKRYFPDSAKFANPLHSPIRQATTDAISLLTLIRANLETPVPEMDSKPLNEVFPHAVNRENHPLKELWFGWVNAALGGDPVRLMRAYVRLVIRGSVFDKELARLFGRAWVKPDGALEKLAGTELAGHHTTLMMATAVMKWMCREFIPAQDMGQLQIALLMTLVKDFTAAEIWKDAPRYFFDSFTSIVREPPCQCIMERAIGMSSDMLGIMLNALWLLDERSADYKRCQPPKRQTYGYLVNPTTRYQSFLNDRIVLRAWLHGLLTDKNVYAWLMLPHFSKDNSGLLSVAAWQMGAAQGSANHMRFGSYRRRHLVDKVRDILGHEPKPEDAAALERLHALAEPLIRATIDAEIHRGDADTPFTPVVSGIMILKGADAFTRLLAALGKQHLVRHDSVSINGRADSLSQLLSTCVPDETDTADTLRTLCKARKITKARLIEAALFCPEWIALIGETLDIPGFASAAWFFIAHMKDDVDDVRQARIARFTPLDGQSLADGAFDLGWFRSVVAQIDLDTLDALYAAAKYITTGARHGRARKYVNAALGRSSLADLAAQIGDKRNQDTLMAYPLVPLMGEDDLKTRYLFLQSFLKGSKQFGAQRAASEKRAVAIGMTNLARNAGFADSMRLTLRMETNMMDDFRPLMEKADVGGVAVSLVIGERGLPDILCEKDDKTLKSIPAKIKKDARILHLTEARKRLTDQHRRTRAMLEAAMEDESAFTAGEIHALMGSPIIAPMLRTLLFLRGEDVGLTDGLTLKTADGKILPLNPSDELRIAHPYHLWQRNVWIAWQERLFREQTVQPFRQVFRELYAYTQDERGQTVTMRYSGYQIQPRKAAACLKPRRWVADAESGLQRVDYGRNIVSVLLANADWFTPADIESPSIDGVMFLHRADGKPVKLEDVPPILFSEVMRDVDLALSVAHVGGVDPETSHATMEMRENLLRLTLPMLGVTNVTLGNHRATVTGTLAKYTVHLGSGVVHQIGGTMISILPVHSGQRGRIFLPFADDDPQTAEVLSKVLLLSDDRKIKDPTILSQIRINP